MRKTTLGTILQVILLFAILPAVACVIGFLPGGPEYLNQLFWSTLGVFEILEGAADVMKSFASEDHTAFIAKSILAIVSESFLQAIILGCCVMTLNDLFSVVKAPFGRDKIFPALYGEPILVSSLGFAIGLALISALNLVDEAAYRATLYALCCIGVLLLGIGIMLGLNKRSALYSKGRVVGLVAKMFMGALFSAALSGAIAGLMQGPIIVAAGGSAFVSVVWYFAMCVAMIVISFLYEVFFPKKK